VRRISFAFVGLSVAVLLGCSQASQEPVPTTPKTAEAEKPAAEQSASGLTITDVVVGTGVVAEPGKAVSVHYRGTLTDGKEFDASRPRGEPFTFELGAGQVIRGWDEGVKGMKVGGKRKLLIPPDMAYGEQGAGGVIPPNATLEFEVELLDVK
jgi:peptidylprolyl isomerase